MNTKEFKEKGAKVHKIKKSKEPNSLNTEQIAINKKTSPILFTNMAFNAAFKA